MSEFITYVSYANIILQICKLSDVSLAIDKYFWLVKNAK